MVMVSSGSRKPSKNDKVAEPSSQKAKSAKQKGGENGEDEFGEPKTPSKNDKSAEPPSQKGKTAKPGDGNAGGGNKNEKDKSSKPGSDKDKSKASQKSEKDVRN